MTIVTGTVLVLVTWAVVALAIVSVGLLPALWLQASRTPSRAGTVRQAMWWGLAISAVLVTLVGMVLPLARATALAVALTAVLVLGVPGWLLLFRRSTRTQVPRRSLGLITLSVAMVLAAVYLAATALGPVTNYDSGLYHLGAIAYARDFAAVPGLANLYSPLGYATVEFPWAAALGNGPWGNEGFRLLNGLIMVLAMADLLLRMRDGRRGPGLPILAVGILAAWVPMLALVDYWVTSPTQDASAFVLSVVASAYLADTVGVRRGQASNAGALGALVITLVMIRPTMVALAITALVVAALVLFRDSRERERRATFQAGALVAGLGMGALVATTARDYLLSGWLQYPLSVFAFDVPWRAAEPSMDRQATLGFHRDPERLWESVEGWDWIGSWWSTRWSQWETYEWLGLAVVCVALLLIAGRTRVPLKWRRLALAMLPSAVAVLFWWTLTPPSYRFAWGPLFTVVTIPIGWMIWRVTCGSRDDAGAALSRRLPALTAVVVGVPIVVVVLYSATARMPWGQFTEQRQWVAGVSIPYVVAPVVDVPVVDVPTTSGLTLTRPTRSDQCWTNYPLCTPRPSPGLRLQGDDLQSGFLP